MTAHPGGNENRSDADNAGPVTDHKKKEPSVDTATLPRPDARITRPEPPCCTYTTGDPVRVLGHTDWAIVVSVGHRFVVVIGRDLTTVAYPPEMLSVA